MKQQMTGEATLITAKFTANNRGQENYDKNDRK